MSATVSKDDRSTDTQRGTLHPRTPPNRDANAAQRAALAVQLRSTKMTYQQIALQCGFSDKSAARKAVMRELDRCVVRNVDLLRNEELESLEYLERECWKRLQDKEFSKSMLFAVDRIISIKERRARLMGLDIKPDENINNNITVVREVPFQYLGIQEANSEHA